MIIMGMCGCDDLEDKCQQLKQIASCSNIGGVFLWEYCLRTKGWANLIAKNIDC